MGFIITEACIGVKDAACVEVCPVDVIHPKPGEHRFALAEQLYIKADECICCGACEPECPVGAIYDEDSVPVEWREYVAKNAAFFSDEPVAAGASRG